MQDGSFFLGSGHIDGKYEYYFYALNSDGSRQIESVDASECRIMEDDTTPRIETVRYVADGKYTNLFYFDKSDSACIIHVPAGSINPVVDLNL